MASDSATALATQQSIKAYVDSQVGTVDTLAEILAIGNTTGATDIAVDSAQKVQFRDAAIYINSSVDGQLDIVADTEIQIAATTVDLNGNLDVSGTLGVTGVLTATSLDISGDIDVDGTTNLDVVDIDGATQIDATVTVGVDDTGYDVKFFGATAGAYMLWDESADDLILGGAAGLSVNSTALVTGVLTTTAATVSNGGGQFNGAINVGVDDTGYDVKFFGATAGAYMLWDESADDLILGGAAGLSVNSTALVTGVLTTTAQAVFNGGFAAGGVGAFADGSLSAPSITNTGDLSTGMYFPSAETIGFTSGGVASFKLDNQGHLIYEGSFQLQSDAQTGGLTIAGGNNSNDGANIAVHGPSHASLANITRFRQDTVESLRIDASGNIIIASTGGTLQTATAGTSNFRAGVNAGNSILSGGNYNVVVGDEAGTAITTGDLMTAVGYRALFTEDTGERSTAVGAYALTAQNSAVENYNTAVGYAAGYAVTTGIENTLIGGLAGDALTDADYNVAVGVAALSGDTLGSKSTALGYYALATQNFTSATDVFNTAVGHNAGRTITTGITNTLIGGLAGDALTDADSNVAVGYNSLSTNTLGSACTAVGSGALFGHNVTSAAQTYNTAVGFDAGNAVTTGVRNTLIGGLAGDAFTDADYNVALGYEALTVDTLGGNSVAIGAFALRDQNFTSATNAYNVGIGYEAGGSITTGVQNTIVGGLAGDAMTTGDVNTFIGYQAAGDGIVTGARNVAVGGNSGLNLTSSNDNTLIGNNAGQNISNLTRNTIIGSSAATSLNSDENVIIGFQAGTYATALTSGMRNCLFGAYTNTDAATSDYANGFGYFIEAEAGYTTVGQASNDIRAAHGVATWSTVSDERYKKDIVDSTAGLSFINALRPRTFKYKTLGELPETFRAYEEGSTEVFKNSNTNHGFIAQEVKAAMDADSSIKDGFGLWGERPDGGQEVAEAALIPMLVKALQELSAKNDALEARIATLEG
jgi:hypothetical protein